ncbi:MAG TPA: MYXO-CTERM sorting domain-containing protein [Kofleriaceae bacterium]|nr:MYXO-CTERM sorting domain-containing protein [Kofleriaceae bacterium]
MGDACDDAVDPEGADGCCGAGGSPGGTWALALLVAVALFRRRRRATGPWSA